MYIITDDKSDDADKIAFITSSFGSDDTVKSFCFSVLLHLIFGTLLKKWSVDERIWYIMLV